MKPILEVQNISKKFLINHQKVAYLSLRDKLSTMFAASGATEEFWALNDVSFTVQPGESVGIIGRNGAGKSTLLKILSRITPPTKGRIVVRGRIASLLEVGTGFHQELSGRENVFMNGSILGMKNAEIKAKFDEIVDFSGTEQFLDTPIKHYSSGMQLRLAFAVAAHLDPEILIIDEVLAVGDAEFQKKCLGKMEDVSKSGRTILFVSHNIDAIEALCKTSVFLDKGTLRDYGASSTIIRNYISNEKVHFEPIELSKNSRLEKFSFPDNAFVVGGRLPFTIAIRKSADTLSMTDLSLLFFNYKKQRVAIYDLRKRFRDFKEAGDAVQLDGAIESFNLIEGFYYVGLYYGIDGEHGDLLDLAKLNVKPSTESPDIKPYESVYRGFVELQ